MTNHNQPSQDKTYNTAITDPVYQPEEKNTDDDLSEFTISATQKTMKITLEISIADLTRAAKATAKAIAPYLIPFLLTAFPYLATLQPHPIESPTTQSQPMFPKTDRQ